MRATQFGRRGLIAFVAFLFGLSVFYPGASVLAAPAADEGIAIEQVASQYGDINTGGNVGNTCVAPGPNYGSVHIDCGGGDNISNIDLTGDTYVEAPVSTNLRGVPYDQYSGDYRWPGDCNHYDYYGNWLYWDC